MRAGQYFVLVVAARRTFLVDQLDHVPELFSHFRPHSTQLLERVGIGHGQVTQASRRTGEFRLSQLLSVGMPSHAPIMRLMRTLDQSLPL